MSEQLRIVDDIPPDTLPAILDAIKGWENGGLNQYAPEGVAILLRLQQALIGTGSVRSLVEVQI
ncbi:hypothetical protein H7097_01405 [Aeromicrobium sp.]|nr:hypothetical protein [Candidatus Saccharibacteria bacterium]